MHKIVLSFFFCRIRFLQSVQYFARKFNARGGQSKTMAGCRVWRIILVVIIMWKMTTNANNADVAQTIANEGDRKSFEPNKYIYSWTGPNALARSALVERQERLQYNCELESSEVDNELNPESFRNILVDDLHELLYCYVPKVLIYRLVFFN